MKYNNYIIVLVLVGLAVTSNFNSYAQQSTNETNFVLSQNNFQLTKNSSNLLQKNLNSFASKIQQGNENYGLNFNQIGNSNSIELLDKNINDTQIVNQIGYNNNYQFINYYNNSVSNFKINQLGTSNDLQIYGENSIIKNLSIIQKTNYKTLIIKNY
ncbi:MAG: hypothetical protein COA92_02235 [Sulfurovum sp.]|nr:MAG: hypothetical protein COA92_02235 [Sulfurovum sp.]